MDIATLGVSLDPSGVVAGKDVAIKATHELAKAMQDDGDKAEKAMKDVGESAAKMGNEVKTAATKAETAVAKTAASPAYEKMKRQATQVASAMKTAMSSANAAPNTGGVWDRISQQATRAAAATKAALQTAGRGIVTTLSAAGTAAGKALSAGITGSANLATGALNRLRSAASGVGGAIKGALSSVGGFKISVTGLIAAVTSLYVAFQTLTASLGAVGDGFSFAGKIQQSQQSLTTLMGTATLAQRTIDELRATSKQGGVDLGGSLETVQKFSALGFTPADAVKLNKSIADIAGTIGLSSARANELGNALAQVQSKGVVSMEELRQQIAEKGIPVFGELAKKIGVSQGALIKMVEEGKVPAKQLIDIFLNLEGGFAKFAGGVERATQTLPGAMERLKANLADTFGIELFSPINTALTPLINRISTAIGKMGQAANAAGRLIGQGLSAFLEPAIQKFEQLGSYLQEMAPKLQAFMDVLQQPGGVKLALDAGIEQAMDMLRRGLEAAGIVWQSLMDRAGWEFLNVLKKVNAPGFFSGLYTDLKNAAIDFVNIVSSGLTAALKGIMTSDAMLFNPLTAPAALAAKAATWAAPKMAAIPRDKDGGMVLPNKPAIVPFNSAWNATKAQPGPATAALNKQLKDAEGAQVGPPRPLAPLPGAGMSGVAAQDAAVKKTKETTDKLKTLADRYVEASMKPLEVMNKTLAEIDMLQSKGYLTTEQAVRARTKANEDYKQSLEGLMTPMQQLMNQWGNMNEVMKQVGPAVAQVFSNDIASSLGDIIDGTKSVSQAFSDMGRMIVNDLARVATQMLVNLAIQKAIGFVGGLIGGGGGTATAAVAVAHTGGTVSSNMDNSRVVGVGAFNNAPHFQHGGTVPGVTSGEVAAVMEPGEQVLTRDSAKDIRKRIEGTGQTAGGSTVHLTTLNVTDMSTVEAHIAKNPDIILNVVGSKASTIRRMLQIPSRMGS